METTASYINKKTKSKPTYHQLGSTAQACFVAGLFNELTEAD